jgi:mannose-6-phosphate isomerase-like protein (cupin superfamily)
MGVIEGEKIQVGQLGIRFLASAAQTGGHADVFEVIIPEGAKVPIAHHHVDVDEVVYGLEGVVTYRVGDESFELRPGQCALAPKGVVHSFENRHSGLAKFLSVLTPPNLGPNYFRDIAAAATPGTPPDPVQLKEIMARYGLVPVPPQR